MNFHFETGFLNYDKNFSISHRTVRKEKYQRVVAQPEDIKFLAHFMNKNRTAILRGFFVTDRFVMTLAKHFDESNFVRLIPPISFSLSNDTKLVTYFDSVNSANYYRLIYDDNETDERNLVFYRVPSEVFEFQTYPLPRFQFAEPATISTRQNDSSYLFKALIAAGDDEFHIVPCIMGEFGLDRMTANNTKPIRFYLLGYRAFVPVWQIIFIFILI